MNERPRVFPGDYVRFSFKINPTCVYMGRVVVNQWAEQKSATMPDLYVHANYYILSPVTVYASSIGKGTYIRLDNKEIKYEQISEKEYFYYRLKGKHRVEATEQPILVGPK